MEGKGRKDKVGPWLNFTIQSTMNLDFLCKMGERDGGFIRLRAVGSIGLLELYDAGFLQMEKRVYLQSFVVKTPQSPNECFAFWILTYNFNIPHS